MLIGSVGALALWFSHPALFVLAGILFALGVDSLVHRDWLGLGKLLAVGCLAGVSFGLNYLVSLQFQACQPVSSRPLASLLCPAAALAGLELVCTGMEKSPAQPAQTTRQHL